MTNIEDYTKILALSHGSYGEASVYELDNKFYVIKSIDLKHLDTGMMLHETLIPMLIKLSNKNLCLKGVSCLQNFFSDNKYLYLVYDHVGGMTLDRYIIPSIGALDKISRKLIDTFAYLHSIGIVHGDIKPENIIITPTGPLVIDFGFSCIGKMIPAIKTLVKSKPQFTDTRLKHLTCKGGFGTPAYIAPEFYESNPINYLATDVYSLGITIRHIYQIHSFPVPSYVQYMTEQDPEKRITLKALQLVLDA